MSVFNTGSGFVATVFDFRLVTLLDRQEIKAEEVFKSQN